MEPALPSSQRHSPHSATTNWGLHMNVRTVMIRKKALRPTFRSSLMYCVYQGAQARKSRKRMIRIPRQLAPTSNLPTQLNSVSIAHPWVAKYRERTLLISQTAARVKSSLTFSQSATADSDISKPLAETTLLELTKFCAPCSMFGQLEHRKIFLAGLGNWGTMLNLFLPCEPQQKHVRRCGRG
jgi:hypothetical protein